MPENRTAHGAPRRPRESDLHDGREGKSSDRTPDARRSFVDDDRVQRNTAARKQKRGDESADPHTEKNLDHGLEETFPASDPVSIHPGSD